MAASSDGREPPRLRALRSTNSSHRHRVAVCVAGALRTFLLPVVQHSFRSHLHHPGYEYFVSTDAARPADSALLVGPIRHWIAGGDSEPLEAGRPNTARRDELPRGRCPRGTCGPQRYLLPAMARLSEVRARAFLHQPARFRELR